MTTALKDVIAFRKKALDFWALRAEALKDKEMTLHAAMHPDVSSIMKGKNVMLFSEMLSSIDFPERRLLVHLLSTGFPVAGAYPKSGVLLPARRTAELELHDLWRLSKTIQKEVATRAGGSEDAEMDAEVYKSTMDEVSRGWLRGPFDPEVLSSRLGCWVPSRRFGIRQGPKIRCIDDYAASRVNETLAAEETVDPDDLDHISINVRAHMAAFTAPPSCCSSSPFLYDHRHPDHAETRLLSRLWDLESAYRQLPRSPAHASLTVIAVWNPTCAKLQYFEQPPLGFGASASVLSFN